MIEKLIEQEYYNTIEQYKNFTSTHEAYTIIKKKVKKAYDTIGHLGFWLDNFWNQIKAKDATDKVKVESVTAMKRYATDAIKEFAQIAACCEKALELFDTEEKQ